jgi:hypothetical protein
VEGDLLHAVALNDHDLQPRLALLLRWRPIPVLALTSFNIDSITGAI